MSDGLDDVFERFLVESLLAMSVANFTLWAIRPRKEGEEFYEPFITREAFTAIIE